MSQILQSLMAAVLLLATSAWRPTAAHAEPASLVPEMLASINQLRAEAGLWSLGESGDLDALAFDRSADMASRAYFSHTNPDGQTVFDLMDQRGLRFRSAAENMAWTTSPEHQASQAVMQSFINSPPHRANLLSPSFDQIGIGVASAGDRLIFTLVFAG